MSNQQKAYLFPTILLTTTFLGGLIGYYFPQQALFLKPLGDIFINLIFTAVVPLVFFSVASAVARVGKTSKMLKIIISMLVSFFVTSVFAALFALVVVTLFPPANGLVMTLPTQVEIQETINLSAQVVNVLTVSDFTKLLSHQNMLALIIFSVLAGLASAAVGKEGEPFCQFLQSGAEVSMKIISFIMYYAPIGFFSYFAVMIAESGSKLVASYFRVMVEFYAAGMVYFILVFSLYAYFAAGREGIRVFWKNTLVPVITSFATCSSAASIPANLQANKKMGVSPDIYETVIPLGAIVHKDGTVIGAMIKIAFLFSVYQMSFSDPLVIGTAVLISVLVGMVMGSIPSGGMLGEMLIVTLYGLPPQALMMIVAFSIMFDPLATMLNVVGDNLCSMLVARWVEGPEWIENEESLAEET